MARLLLMILSLIPPSLSYAQTRFYRLSFVMESGTKKSVNSSGIFVTFTEKGCYDSDRDGFSMNNGFLKFAGNGNKGILYQGQSYWGSADYCFASDYSVLNVRDKYGVVYVYHLSSPNGQSQSTYYSVRRSTAPSSGGVTTVMPNMPSSDSDDFDIAFEQKIYDGYARNVESIYNILTKDVGGTRVRAERADEFSISQLSMHEEMVKNQQEMRRIRREAQRKGYTIVKSHWETISLPRR